MKFHPSKIVIFILSCILSVSAFAGEGERLDLWPGQPDKDASLFIYRPAARTDQHPAILICPGGGYGGLAIDHEGHKLAEWFASEGFVAVVLKYRMPKGEHAIPLSDAEQAMKTIRSKAASWQVDTTRIGVIGSSAGGHLAASLSTLAAKENRPDFAILYYPVISFDNMTTHGGTKQNLLGKEINNPSLIERYSLEKQVDENTPPTVLFLSDDDEMVPTANSILYYTALQNRKIPAAMYVFPSGRHGWGFNEDFTYHEDVKVLTLKWLKHIKIR